MHSIFFWKDWPKNYKALWFLLSGIFLMSLLFMWFTWFQGAHGIIHWEKLQEQEIIETTVHQFRLGPFQLNVPGESYVIFEYLQGSNVEHNKVASYIFLAVLISSSMVMLTIITTLRKFWYFIGIALFCRLCHGASSGSPSCLRHQRICSTCSDSRDLCRP